MHRRACSFQSSFRRAAETDPRLRYRERLEVFARVFGADRCVVRPYERSQLKDGDLLRDMLALPPPTWIPPPPFLGIGVRRRFLALLDPCLPGIRHGINGGRTQIARVHQ